tara:strand:- start:50897 stop:51538 length:642 start_codon:yes stop_codon:yes gene_type:complete
MIYRVSKKFDSKVARSPRVLEVAEAFGLGLADKEFVIYDDLEIPLEKGDVAYITGQSGSGKSLLLRDLRDAMTAEGLSVTDLDSIVYRDIPLIDQVGSDMTQAVRLLSIAGLNDAYLFVRTPDQLSDGQKYRFKLAKMIESSADVWVADEFTAALDRVTAQVVAFNMQKAARKFQKTLIVATTHMDLMDSLKPNLYVEKYFREQVKVECFGVI